MPSNEIYQELRDADFDEREIEQRVGEGWTLAAIKEQAIADGLMTPDA